MLITATAINARSSLHTYTHSLIDVCVGGRVLEKWCIHITKAPPAAPSALSGKDKLNLYFSLAWFLSTGSRNIFRPCRPLSLSRLWTTDKAYGFDPQVCSTGSRLMAAHSQKTTWLKPLVIIILAASLFGSANKAWTDNIVFSSCSCYTRDGFYYSITFHCINPRDDDKYKP